MDMEVFISLEGSYLLPIFLGRDFDHGENGEFVMMLHPSSLTRDRSGFLLVFCADRKYLFDIFSSADMTTFAFDQEVLLFELHDHMVFRMEKTFNQEIC